MSETPYLVLEGLEKSFGSSRVLSGLSLGVQRGEIFALLGASGSGKTTALRLLAGFEAPDGGSIRVDGQDLTGESPARRRFGMVFQHYALFPHLTVGENVAFGLEGKAGQHAERIEEMLERVRLGGFAERPVTALSGGQQQRVALARALAPEPRVLLLDEPLSNLDPNLRESTRRELRDLIQRLGITTVLVTHEQEEAFDLGDRVGVLHEGALRQVGPPEELYEAPSTPFIAGFVGRVSVLIGKLQVADGGLEQVRFEASGGPVIWPGRQPTDGGPTAQPGEQVRWAARPEALSLVQPATPGSWPGRVVDRRFAGALTYYKVVLAGAVEAEVEVLGASSAAVIGDPVWLRANDDGPRPMIFPMEAD